MSGPNMSVTQWSFSKVGCEVCVVKRWMVGVETVWVVKWWLCNCGFYDVGCMISTM